MCATTVRIIYLIYIQGTKGPQNPWYTFRAVSQAAGETEPRSGAKCVA